MKNISKTNKSKQKWLEKGYECFALYGPDNLNINQISKDIGLARSTFYHYFGDLDVFIDELLDLHNEINSQFVIVGAKECKNLIPDLYNILELQSIPLRFSKQLFLNRHILKYNYLFIKTYTHCADSFILKLFSDQFKLNQSQETLNNLWVTVGESWYSRLDIDDLSSKKMQFLAKDIIKSVIKFIPTTNTYNKL